MRTNLFYIVLSAIFLSIGSAQLFAQEFPEKSKSFPAKKESKPIEDKVVNTKQKTEVTTISKDTIKLDSLKPKKAFLEGKVKYKAKEYARFDQKKKLITLYDGAELFYQDYELKSGIIIFDYQKNEVYAGRIKDSIGNYTQYPYFKQGSNIIEPDSIRFNYKTKKALVWNSRTTQQELNIKAEVSKKVSDSVYFMKGARITTAKDLDDPEYYFLARKVKFVPGKKVVVGFTNMYIANVPTPIALPFAFFPMTETNRSGIIVPSYGNSEARGYSLQNGGYYFALSNKYDLALLGDYYTNGSYSVRAESSYANKYKYSGNVNFRFEDQINSERGYPDYSKTKIYNIIWSHSKDAKSNPNSRFSASVNLGSSKYFQQSISQSNYTSAINNSMNSSISFSSTIHTIPQINYSLSATHSQNTNTKAINMTLPTFQASVDRVYPFVGKNGVKKGFVKNINLQYSVNGRNSYETTDDYFFKTEMFKNAKTGFEHTIPLTTNFKVFKYFNVSPSANYKEVWTMSTIKRSQDFVNNKAVDTKVNGFDSYRTYSFSNGLSTTLYGTYNFKKGSRIQSIRHVVKPSVNYSYSPSFDKYYNDSYESDRVYSNVIESKYTNYSRFEGTVYGAPGNSISNNLGFSLSNTFEAKVTDKDSTKTEPKKISLLNNLTFGTNYNLVEKKWNAINFSGGTSFFKQKMTVNFGGTIDPYEYVVDDYYRNPFSVANANLSMNYSFTSNSGKKEKNTKGQQNGGRNDDLFGSSDDLNDVPKVTDEDETDKFSGFYNAELPFDMNLAYTMSYINSNLGKKISSASLMITANTDLTPNWKIGVSTGYDFVNKGFSTTQLRLNRDLKSWNMSFNWNPFGKYSYWGFFIGIKASVLSDIKWDKHTQPDRSLK